MLAVRRLRDLAFMALVLAGALAAIPGHAQERLVRVGVYQNAPQVFLTDDGEPRGIYVDILKEVARLEGWRLEFVPGSFAEGLEAVRTGDIDVMTSIASTPERETFVDFSKETVVSVWGQLYVRPDLTPQNILDMESKSVAVMRDGILGERYRRLCHDFGVDCRIVPLGSYDEALQAVDDGKADAAVVNSILGFARESRYHAKRSSIVFSPFRLQVAVPEGRDGDVTAALDRHLAAWRKDKSSFYYRTLDRWIGVKPEETTAIPQWVIWLLAGGTVLIALFSFWTVTLRRHISQRLAAEQKLAERTAELEKSEKKYRSIFEASKVGLALCRMDGTLVECNQAYLDMIGYTDEEARDLTYWDLTPREYEPQEFEQLKSIEETGGYGPYEKTYIRKDGSRVPVLLNGTKLQGPDGKDYIWSIVQDITERKAYESELATKSTALEHSNDDLQQFAYVASHDLREPLRMVSAYLQLLNRKHGDRLDHEAHEYIHFAVDGAKRMDALIRDLLDYSRVQTRGEEFSEVDLDEILQETKDNLQASIVEAAAAVTWDNLPTIEADRSQMVRLFQNLIGNALKYRHPDRPPVIHVSANRNGGEWKFSVRDNGLGIETEYFERIFVIFQRLHARDAYGGTGMGLAICKKIVERHDGHIWVESTAGEGSTFHFTLPASA